MKKNFFLAASTLLIFLLCFLPPLDTDLGWHIRLGEELVKGNFNLTNSFTYYLAGYLWNNSYTLYNISVYLVNKLAGFLGLGLANAILLSLTLLLFLKFSPKLPKISFWLFLAIVFAGWNVFYLGLRSQIFSFTGLVAVFLILKKAREKVYLLYCLPLIFFLWANIHGAFILGFIPILAALLNLSLQKDRKLALHLSVATLASFVATFINPYGVGIYQEAWTHFVVPLGGLIAEWVAPRPFWQVLIIFLALSISVVTFYAKGEKKIFWLPLIVLFSYLALTSRRNLPFFFLITAFFVLETFENLLTKYEAKKPFEEITYLAITFGIVLLFAVKVPQTFQLSASWEAYCENPVFPHPCKAAEFAKKNNLRGEHVFTAYEWGGFLEWQMPGYKYFVDGRMPAWPTPEGKSPYTVYLETIQAQPGYQETLDKYKTDWLLIGSGSFLDLELSGKKNSIWKEIYRDSLSVIYTTN